MKVFGTIISSTTDENTALGGETYHRQIRVCVAAKSVSEAIRKFGLTASGRDYISETGNPAEVDIALSKPGQVFASSANYPAKIKFIEIERKPHVPMKRSPSRRSVPPSSMQLPPRFTREEIEYLRDLMLGANHPTAISIGEKASRILDSATHKVAE